MKRFFGASEQEIFAQENIDKAVNGYNAIKDVLEKIRDRELSMQLIKMQHISRKMLEYLKSHPEKVSLATQFIDYYQEKTLVLAQHFVNLESTGLNTPDVIAAKQNVKNTLSKFDDAYEVQFSRLISDNILNLNAEIAVAKQILQESGIENVETVRPEDFSSQSTGEMSIDPMTIPMPDVEGYLPPQTASNTKPLTNYITRDQVSSTDWKSINSTRRPDEFYPPEVAKPSFFQNLKKWGMFYPMRHTTMPDVKKLRTRRQIAGLTGVLTGFTGMHKFLMGSPKMGLLYLLFCWTGIPGIVGFVEGLRYLCMSDEKFYEKYFLPKFDD